MDDDLMATGLFDHVDITGKAPRVAPRRRKGRGVHNRAHRVISLVRCEIRERRVTVFPELPAIALFSVFEQIPAGTAKMVEMVTGTLAVAGFGR
ncbi:hypothetical protein [Actinomadura sp. 1N219]|uniref:hypothetical protein n=1 Tax=Actinomadura sp. 1N219 TaxID=3375152 RepID=UPI0037C131C8